MKKILLSFISIIFAINALRAQNDSIQFPVSLSSLEAAFSNNSIKLKWKTTCYISFANFQIQKSINGTVFSTIHHFTADKFRCSQPFEFIDSAANTGKIFYRINAGDIDGHFYHSKVININTKKTDVEMLSVYPTIVHSTAIFVFSSPYGGNIKMNLTNSEGVVIKQYSYTMQKGVSNFNLDLSSLSKGNYWISYLNTKGKLNATAIVKQ